MAHTEISTIPLQYMQQGIYLIVQYIPQNARTITRQ